MTTVRTYRSAGTGVTIIDAWEPFDNHSTMRSERDADGECTGWLGLITARPLPVEIEAMVPGSLERMSAAIDHHAACVTDALAAIAAAHPGILERPDARIDGGRVELTGDLEPICRNCGQRQSVNPHLWTEVDGLGFCWPACAEQYADPVAFAKACRVER